MSPPSERPLLPRDLATKQDILQLQNQLRALPTKQDLERLKGQVQAAAAPARMPSAPLRQALPLPRVLTPKPPAEATPEGDYDIARIVVNWAVNTWKETVRPPAGVTAWRMQNLGTSPVNWSDRNNPKVAESNSYGTLEPKSMECPPFNPEVLYLSPTDTSTPTVVIIWTTSTDPNVIARITGVQSTGAVSVGAIKDIPSVTTWAAAVISVTISPGSATYINGDWGLIYITVKLGTAYTGDLIVSFDSVDGTAYDTQAQRATLVAETDATFVFGADAYRFGSGDAVIISSSAVYTGQANIVVKAVPVP